MAGAARAGGDWPRPHAKRHPATAYTVPSLLVAGIPAAGSSLLRRTIWNSPTIAAARPAVAPTRSDQRGPKWSATQPTSGAPIGVPPRVIASRIAITRPRMTGSVANCIRLLVELLKVSADTPMITSVTPNSQ